MNPFCDRFELTCPRLLKLIIIGIFLVPIRLILVGCLSLVMTPFYLALSFSIPAEKSDDCYFYSKSWQRKSLQVLAVCTWLQLNIMGIHTSIEGKIEPKKKAPIIVAAGHSSFLDSWILSSSIFLQSKCQLMTIAEKKNFKLKWNGFLPLAMRPQLVTRTETAKALILFCRIIYKGSRQKAFEKVKQLLKETEASSSIKLSFFAEGSVTNRTAMLKFKTGAFRFGLPVQPLYWKIENEDQKIFLDNFSCGLLTQKQSMRNLILSWFNSRLHITIHFLPVYNPSLEEISDPQLYCQNVQTLISENSGIPISEFHAEDILVYSVCREEGLSDEECLEFAKIGINEIKHETKSSFAEILDLIKQFIRLNRQYSDNQAMEKPPKDLSELRNFIHENLLK